MNDNFVLPNMQQGFPQFPTSMYDRVGQPRTNKIYVNGIQDVNNYRMPPGADFIFVHNNENLLYRKVTDAFGKFVVETYRITPETSEQNVDFVSKDEFKALQEEINNLKQYLPKVSTTGGNNELPKS